MLKIVKSSEAIAVETIVLCVYSPPGLGKTTLGFTADDPLDLDFDKGAYRAANRKDSVQVSKWSDVAGMTAEDLAPYKTVIMDTAGRALDALMADIIGANPKMGRGGALTLQGFGELKSKFAAWLRMLRSFGKDIVLIAHMDEQRSGDDVIERLDVQGGSKGEIYKSADAMGRLIMRTNERFLDFNPRENSFGKNPCNLPVMPVPLSNPNLLGEVIATIKERLNVAAEESKAAVREIQDWSIVFGEVKTTDEINELLPQVKKATPAIRALAQKRARDLGFVFDKASNLYVSGVAHAVGVR